MLAPVLDRRRYPRVAADVLCRSAGLALLHHRRNTKDISLGGMRVFTDEEFSAGSRLELDVYLPDGGDVRCWAQVMWQVKLADGGPARFDVGLKFLDMAPVDLQRLSAVLIRPA